jgi:tripartite-type tricarboxylate transporter receptor subunit TctC
MVTSMVSALNQVKAGQARLLAVTGPQRSHLFPDVPTLGESGFPGFEDGAVAMVCWRPPRFHARLSRALNRETVKVLGMPDVQRNCSNRKAGLSRRARRRNSQHFFVPDVDRWTKIVKQQALRWTNCTDWLRKKSRFRYTSALLFRITKTVNSA